jgi:hypothetical protein
MKYLPFACFCLLFAPPTNVCADLVNGIDILSSVYSVDAPWSYTWYTYTGSVNMPIYSSGSGNYGGSSSDGSPLSGHLTSAGPFPPGLPFPGVSGSTYIDRFTFGNNTSAAGNPWNGPYGDRYFTGSDGAQYFLQSRVQPEAQASWTFRPTGDSLQIALHISEQGHYDGYQSLSVNFSDITSSTVLLAFSHADILVRGGDVNATDLFSVSTGDTYELTVHGWANTYDDDYANQYVTASIQIVPEPRASGLCLLGLLSLAGFKRWPLGHPRR